MNELVQLRAALAPADDQLEGRVTARMVPFGETIEHRGREVSFERGSISWSAEQVYPVNLDHGDGSLDRIGRLTNVMEADDGLYAELQISDTAAGRDALTLMSDGVLTDVSVGVWMNEDGAHDLDHLAVVGRGAFGDSGAGSRVLAVHAADDEGVNMADETNVVADDDNDQTTEDFSAELTELRRSVAELALPGAVSEPMPLLGSRIQELAAGGGGSMEFALEAETTTTVAGLVPDYQSAEVIAVIADGRPFISSIPRDGIGNAGMTIDYPIVTAPGAVDVQATENTEVASSPFEVGTQAHDLLTFAGANILSRQLVERSAPSALQTYLRVMAGNYADRTELHAVTAASQAAVTAGNTAVLADFGASAAATFAAISAAASEVASDVRRPATHMVVGINRWTQLNSLADTDGRPILVYPPNGPSNAAGQSSFATMRAQYHGLEVLFSPAADADAAFVYSAERSSAWLEQNPVDLRAEVVSTLSWEVGIYGLGVVAPKYPSGGYAFTVI